MKSMNRGWPQTEHFYDENTHSGCISINPRQLTRCTYKVTYRELRNFLHFCWSTRLLQKTKRKNNLHQTKQKKKYTAQVRFSFLNGIDYLHKNKATEAAAYNGIHIGKYQHLWEDQLYFQTNAGDDYCGDAVEVQHRLTGSDWIKWLQTNRLNFLPLHRLTMVSTFFQFWFSTEWIVKSVDEVQCGFGKAPLHFNWIL